MNVIYLGVGLLIYKFFKLMLVDRFARANALLVLHGEDRILRRKDIHLVFIKTLRC